MCCALILCVFSEWAVDIAGQVCMCGWNNIYISFSSQSEKDSKEEILKAFKLFDDDETVCFSPPQTPHMYTHAHVYTHTHTHTHTHASTHTHTQ